MSGRTIEEVQVFKDKTGIPDEWRVEAYDSDGGIEVTIFSGPRAESRAGAYAEREYGRQG
jgi:hypothetical protein